MKKKSVIGGVSLLMFFYEFSQKLPLKFCFKIKDKKVTEIKIKSEMCKKETNY